MSLYKSALAFAALVLFTSVPVSAATPAIVEPEDVDRSAATAVQYLQVNYYWDGGCSDWANSLSITFNDPSRCIQYDIEGSWSANIAACKDWSWGCYCDFYSDANCKNHAGYVDGVANNKCANNGGKGFRLLAVRVQPPLKCGYSHYDCPRDTVGVF